MKTIELNFFIEKEPAFLLADMESYIHQLKKIFPLIMVDEESSIEKGINALKAELACGTSETKVKAFSRIIRDRESMLPAITFQISPETDVVGMLNGGCIRLSRRSKEDIPLKIEKEFFKFINSVRGDIFVDGVAFQSDGE